MIFIRGFLKNLVICAMCGFFSFCDLVAMIAEIPTYDPDDATVKRVTAYVRECINPHMKKVGKARLNGKQQAYLYSSVEGVAFRDIGGTSGYKEKRKKFESGKIGLRNAWCASYKIPEWPTTPSGRNYDAHHIIPLQLDGENMWWNLVPLTEEAHDLADAGAGGIAGGGISVTNQWLAARFKEMVVDHQD